MAPSRCCKNGGDIKSDKKEMMEEKELGDLGLIALGLGLLVDDVSGQSDDSVLF